MPKKATTEVVKFDVETAVIVALDSKYKNIQITDGKSYALVMAAIGEYRDLRLAVVDGHKEAKKEILEKGNFLDSEKRRILARLAPGEEKLKTIRQAWDDEKERIKKEKARIEEERIQSIREAIYKIQILTGGINLMDLESLQNLSGELEAMEITSEKYMELAEEANKVLDTTYETIQDAITARIKLDQEAEERRAEAERLEAQKKEQEAAQAKIDKANQAAAKRQAENDARMAADQAKIDEEKRKIEDERHRLERVKQIEKAKKEREEFERQAKIKAEAEAATAAAQKVKDDAKEKEEKDRAEEVESERKEALRPDKEKLVAYSKKLTSLTLPQVKRQVAKTVVDEIYTKVKALALFIIEKAEKL